MHDAPLRETHVPTGYFFRIPTGKPDSVWKYEKDKNLRTIPIFNFGEDFSTDCIELQEGKRVADRRTNPLCSVHSLGTNGIDTTFPTALNRPKYRGENHPIRREVMRVLWDANAPLRERLQIIKAFTGL